MQIMRKFLLLAIAVLFTGITMAGSGFTVKYSQNSDSERQLSFSLDNYSIETVSIDGQTYSKIIFEGQIVSTQKGWAELPFISSSIQISNDKNVSLDVSNSQFTDIQLDYPLLPSRGVIYRNQDPASIPYEIDPASMIDTWYPKALSTSDAPYILRDVRGTNVKVFPFRYNAKQNTLRVYTQVDVIVSDDNSDAINPKTKMNTTVIREMDAMYKSIFVNYGQSSKEDLTIGEYGDILVICTERDEEAIQPYIEWKKEKGFNVSKEVVETSTNVKSNIQTAYDNNPNLLYVQLVGDWADIKSDLGGGANAPMDPMLGCVEGNDNYPELAIGRFSGTSPAHITTQVNKTITYEKTPQTDAEWYSHSLAIGSDQGSSNGDDGEMDKTHVQIIYDNKLDPFTYDQLYTSYDPGANSNQVATAVNEGISIANYCGHGSNTEWVTSGFSNSDINQLTNGDKLPFLFSVACVNGAFHSGECFGEAWLKKDGGGAVMALMSTINQPWQPPMRGQDYFNDILTGGYDYDNNPGNGTNTEEGRSFLGSIVVNGLILMYAESSGGSDLETIQTWTTFGDCSLQARTIAPAELSLSTDVVISGVDYSAVVTSDGNPVEGAMVGLSQADGDLYYNAVTDENGEVTIAHELLPGDAKLVVTAYNTQTIYSDIVVISPDGPYLVIDGFDMNTDDGMVIYNSEVSMDITFKNLGSDPATGVSVTLTSEDDYCTLLTETTINVGTIGADETVTIEDAFSFSVADNVPDQYSVSLSFDINGTAKELWQDNVTFKVNAPALNTEFVEIDDSNGGDGNGRLDAGETAIIKLNGLNIGHADSPEASMSLSSSSPYITINTASVDLGVLATNGDALAEFEVVVSDDAPVGVLANFSSDLVAGGYNHNFTMMLNIGLVVEDFETGDFTQYDWQFAGSADWEIIEGSDVYEGTYSAKSMNISGSQYASLNLDVDVSTESPVSFYLKVSSESGYDRLKFYIDATEIEDWSGEVAWQMVEFTVPEGNHTLKWTYSKDGSVDGGSDCAWVDYIILPGAAGGAPLFADFLADNQDICEGETVNFTSSSIGDVTTYSWTFEGGDPATSDEEAPVVIYTTPGTYSVSLTISDGNSENTMTKDGFITVHNCTGVNEAAIFNMEIYPNPNSGVFTLVLNQNAKVEIINALGSVVFTEEFIGKQTIDLANQAEGIYFIKVETENESKVEKIVVRR
jgi:PKD repeat protein